LGWEIKAAWGEESDGEKNFLGSKEFVKEEDFVREGCFAPTVDESAKGRWSNEG
jgi:hypothetical protein